MNKDFPFKTLEQVQIALGCYRSLAVVVTQTVNEFCSRIEVDRMVSRDGKVGALSALDMVLELLQHAIVRLEAEESQLSRPKKPEVLQ